MSMKNYTFEREQFSSKFVITDERTGGILTIIDDNYSRAAPTTLDTLVEVIKGSLEKEELILNLRMLNTITYRDPIVLLGLVELNDCNLFGASISNSSLTSVSLGQKGGKMEIEHVKVHDIHNENVSQNLEFRFCGPDFDSGAMGEGGSRWVYNTRN